jgi:hypothetical protein
MSVLNKLGVISIIISSEYWVVLLLYQECQSCSTFHTSDSISYGRPSSSSWNTSGNHLNFSIIQILFEYSFLCLNIN